jgi:hypothetical protein
VRRLIEGHKHMISAMPSSDGSLVPDDKVAARPARLEKAPENDDDFRDRMRVNLFAAIALIALTLFGVWLANTMVRTQKAQGCYSSGERTCSLI